jgi:deoxyribonuclease V
MVTHAWKVSPAEAIAIQRELAVQVVRRWDRRRKVGRVAGVDMAVKGERARAAVVVSSFPDLIPLEQRTAELALSFPYVPGLLSFRECPAVLKAFSKIRNRPGLILVDGQGIAHPRRLGIASHLGLLLDLPAIGCAKSRLLGEHEEPDGAAGSYTLLRDRGETVGAVLRTRDGVKPLYISIGHRIDLDHALDFTLACCRGYRLTEPIRMAHQAAGGRWVV